MSGEPSQPAPRRLEALTTLRFFAALHVTLFHLLGLGTWGLPARLEAAIRAGPVSVSFFFVLSGFILTQAYAKRPPHRAPWTYARSRFARLYPLYALGLLLMAPSWFLHGGELAPSLATSALVQAWWPPWANAWNPPAWSLSAEAFFYVMFPLLLPWTLRASKRVLWALASAGWAAMLLVAVVYVVRAPDGLAHVDSDSQAFWLDALKFHPLVRLPEFFVGLALGRAALDGARLPAGWGVGAALALVAALFVSDLAPYPVLHNGLFTPLFALVILSAATSGPTRTRALLEHRWLVALGEASYALYILQAPMLGAVHGVLKRLISDPQTLAAVFHPVGLVAVIAGSLIAWRYLEKPARGWLLKVGTRPAPTRVTVG